MNNISDSFSDYSVLHLDNNDKTEDSSSQTRRVAQTALSSSALHGTPENGIRSLGLSKNVRSLNTKDSDLLARAVMRNSSNEAKQALYELHSKLKEKLLIHSDEALEWMLGGASKTARAGFQNARSVKSFLNRNPEEMSK